MTAKIKVNRKVLQMHLNKRAGPRLHQIYNQKVRAAIEKAQEEMIREFEEHLITQEIEGGPHASNTSGTLGGVGNLFSFIGFEEQADPISPIRSILRRAIKIKSLPPGHKSLIQKFIITMPSKEAILERSPMPWASGRSWVDGIEKGISGLGQYLSGAIESSRSGGGVQTKTKLRGGGFSNTSYLSEILNNFERNIKLYMR